MAFEGQGPRRARSLGEAKGRVNFAKKCSKMGYVLRHQSTPGSRRTGIGPLIVGCWKATDLGDLTCIFMVNFFGEGDVVLMRVLRIVLLKVERSNWSLDLYAPIPLALNLTIFINLQHLTRPS